MAASFRQAFFLLLLYNDIKNNATVSEKNPRISVKTGETGVVFSVDLPADGEDRRFVKVGRRGAVTRADLRGQGLQFRGRAAEAELFETEFQDVDAAGRADLHFGCGNRLVRERFAEAFEQFRGIELLFRGAAAADRAEENGQVGERRVAADPRNRGHGHIAVGQSPLGAERGRDAGIPVGGELDMTEEGVADRGKEGGGAAVERGGRDR